MKMKFLTILALFLLFSCQDAGHTHSDHAANMDDAAEEIFLAPETEAMNIAVKTAYSKVDPTLISYYLNNARAAYLKGQMLNATGSERFNFQYRYANELLNSGKTREAIVQADELLAKLEELNRPENEPVVTEMLRFLALCYMRLGEQENCIINHSAAACIIPITPEGQHKKAEGSTRAIELYEKILSREPMDYQSRYLLNIAYMTLGKYPNDVPVEYFIGDLSPLESDFPRFRNRAMDLGIDINDLSGGVCLDDFNSDGRIDILASSWGADDQIRLFKNMGDAGFEEVTEQAGLKGVSSGLNIQHADYNNDGHLDFLILRGAWFNSQGRIPNSLMRNNGDGTFTDVTRSAGVYNEAPTQTAAWGDFNNDGWIDFIVGNESSPNFSFPCEVYRNNGDGTFTDLADSIGLTDLGFVKAVNCGDVNNDGKLDVFISRLGDSNMLLLNESDGYEISFTDISKRALVDKPLLTFPSWIFDFNNDGYEDIFVSSYNLDQDQSAAAVLSRALVRKDEHPLRPRLYLNKGNVTFVDASVPYGLTEPVYTMGCNYGDLNNDGYLDFYLGTGEPNLNSIVPNKMYLNEDGTGTRDVTYSGGFGHIQKGHGVGFADLDNDGDEDIYAVMGGAFEGDNFQNAYFENPMGDEKQWIAIRLEGKESNRAAIGARIVVEITENGEPRKIYRRISTGASFGGNSLTEHIGIGAAEQVDRLSVIWPNSERDIQVFEGIPANSYIELEEGGILEFPDRGVLNFPSAASDHDHKHH